MERSRRDWLMTGVSGFGSLTTLRKYSILPRRVDPRMCAKKSPYLGLNQTMESDQGNIKVVVKLYLGLNH